MAELFSVERLEEHGESLATAQRTTERAASGRRISPRVSENGRVLLDSYRSIAKAIREERTITPAAEWFVDNYHIVDEQLREIRDDLPTDYYRQLPKLAEGHLEGYPRVLGIAWAYVAHTDSRFDLESLRSFVRAYERVEPLTIGELWAIAISLRIILVENLRRLAEEMVSGRAARESANELADTLLGLHGERTDVSAATFRRAAGSMPTAGLVQLVQRLRDQDPAITPALGWLEGILAERGVTADELVREEHQRQAAMNVTVQNVITSMRQISWSDWREFVESVSLIDTLLGDRGVFGALDFPSRDRYRHAIEELARSARRTEQDVTQAALGLAAAADAAPDGDTAHDPASVADSARRMEPGYYLISHGRPELERAIGYDPPLGVRVRRASMAAATPLYLGSTILLTLLALAIPVVLSADAVVWSLVVVAALALVPASEIAVSFVNWVVAHSLAPRHLPRLDMSAGIPTELRTLVAVPTLLGSEAEIEAQIERLEVQYLANADGDIRFALLSDWLDADAKQLPSDEALLATAVAGIDRLNATHGDAPGGGSRFLLFHRERRWNESQGTWMGWERKRGKLHELNALLRGSRTTSFLVSERPSMQPPDGVHYVISLDADTRLPRGAAANLVGTMAHPLHRPSFSPQRRRVVDGYALLQPRITATLPTEHDASIYQRLFSGSAGIDPYTVAVSDVYQDLFGEGSYAGKGIYDIDAFERALADRVPENALLSHDLFEGIFARAGLATDIELFEEFPSRYEEATTRQHRWARGDWQLLPWIVGRSPITAIGRWKMIDNLRRSLVAPLSLATLLAAWTLPGVPVATWTLFVLASVVVPALIPILSGIIPRRRDISKRSHIRAVALDVVLAAGRVALQVTLMAHEAALMTDAIVRTLARLVVTHRHMLEWVTAAQAKARADLGVLGMYRRMADGVLIAVATAVLVLLAQPHAIAFAAPFIALWLISPGVARVVSLPPPRSVLRELSSDEVRILRRVGRRTWRYFESFVGAEDNDLPPDNFQATPESVVAHRTSPTNIGLYLLATVTARDLGWIGTLEMVERLERTLATLDRLEHHGGHLLNWYDTRDLRPLEPAYISMVDSGNLCGHLLALAGACREILDRPLPIAAAMAGIRDTTDLAREAAATVEVDRRTQTTTHRHLADTLAELDLADDEETLSAAAWLERLEALAATSSTLADVVRAMTAERGQIAGGELTAWAEAVTRSISSHVRDAGLHQAMAALRSEDGSPPTLRDLVEDRPAAAGGRSEGADLVRRLMAIADTARRQFDDADFRLLFEPRRKLFSIGYRVRDSALDPSCYDLLASEARLGSFLAIAKGDVEPSHWFRLGRSLTPVGRGSVLISWSGSMFEYLMPVLVMRAPWLSLLAQTSELAVARQIAYGDDQGVPWGISESAFNARDIDGVYQYSSFGVPGLGLKRGLDDDLVVAPYATALAAMVQPKAAVRNLARLADAGGLGPYGYRESLDYTPRRLPEGAQVAVVDTYMAHHQGMTVVAIGNVVEKDVMVRRLHSEPIVQATELLLHERMPRDVQVARMRSIAVKGSSDVRDRVEPITRRFTSPHDITPRTHVLSNGRYAVMTTSAGSGYSSWRDIDVTRWREDVTCDAWGSYIFLRDTQTGLVWSTGHQPVGLEADRYDVRFSEDRVQLSRRDGSLTTDVAIVVSAEDDAEIRRVTLTNLGSRSREIDVTSYMELALARRAADIAHPAFQKLFIQTEFDARVGALLATRRPRAADDPRVWAAHVSAVEETSANLIQYETDRARFLGRGHILRSPVSIVDGRPLSNTVGTVLDPIFSLRRRVTVPAGATAHVLFSTVVADSREAVVDLADKYRDAVTFDRAATLAWTQAQVQLHHLGIESDEAHLFQRLANRILYSDPSMRPAASTLARNTRGARGLWGHGISGDLPIVLIRIAEPEGLDLVRQLLRAHEYWRMKLLDVDLVIVNEQSVSYARELQEALEAIVRMSRTGIAQDAHVAHGRVHILRGDLLHPDDRTLLLSAARVVILSRAGTLVEQVTRLDRPERVAIPPLVPTVRAPGGAGAAGTPKLELFNGLGGFAEGGRDYVVTLGPGQSTPAPWLNVIANPGFGFQVSESGSGYTWAENSRENQLTPWSNDPVSDPSEEAIYVRDEASGEVWGPTASPIRVEGSTYTARHGHGFSSFEHERDGVRLELVQFVPLDDPIKISLLSIENRSARTRRLSVTAYAGWTLGTTRGAAAHHIVTMLDQDTRTVLARNPWNGEFGGGVAFLDMGGRQAAWTCDRTEFLGRNGGLSHPAALLEGKPLSGTVGPGLDPCAVVQARVEIAPGQRTEIPVLLGQAAHAEAASALVKRWRAMDLRGSLAAVRDHWRDLLGTIQVATPDRSMDVMLDSWLLYQAIACRMWARSAFYQAGGAYGFRDQLQDILPLLLVRPTMAREHILRAAARQFPEGDVQHWWHPPTGRGVRTRISDDRLWLAYAVDRYLRVTDDRGVLDEPVPFLDAPRLTPDQDEAYLEPTRSEDEASLYEHCARAIDASLGTGSHGLPLMGAGDWNDGMNRVGHDGKGESVWLGWFLHTILEAFAPIADQRGEQARGDAWRRQMKALRRALERHGWDGDWYRRAFFDDGTPLGSSVSVECRIDSIAQSWSVLSGVAPLERARRAMAAMDGYLVNPSDDLVLLFTPPFDRTELDPGYIKGYPPGIRENGGQYTHGAIWSVLAYAALGDGDKAHELFSMLTPINHSASRAGVHRYKVEPYVMAADVYSEPPHVGRGGWTWYTGSAGWMYQAGVEAILGVRLRGSMLSIEPCIPRSWPGYRIDYRRGSTRYEIAVDNPEGVNRGVVSVELDGIVIDGPDAAIPLDDDGGSHSVRVVMGTSDDGSPRRRAGPAATSSPSEPSRKRSGVAATDIRPV